MFEVFGITFPFFVLVLAGFLATSKKLLPLESIPGLNIFVLYFALPCMLFRFGAQSQLGSLISLSVFITYFLGAVLMVGLALYISRAMGIGWNNAAFGALVAAFPNTGFMGVPLLFALFGTPATATAIITIIIDMIFTTSLCIALSRLEGADIHGTRTALVNAFKGILVNPMPWAIGLGVVFCDLNWTLWAPINKTVQLLSDAASPTALFTLGAVLARSWINQVNHQANIQDKIHLHHKRVDYLTLSFLKLVIHPCIILILGNLALFMGFVLDPFALKIMVLNAALPSASNVVMLTQRYGADSERVAKIILCTTAIAFLSFSSLVRVYDSLLRF